MGTLAINHSARRINALAEALGAKRYLEIGVHAGETFVNINIEERTGVDPNFVFDTSKHENRATRFFPIPSDEFFVNSRFGGPYDIIFIDGLHTFEQTYRDFMNALMVAHRKTVWLIDDTFPCDIFSAWPQHGDAVRFRRESGVVANSGAWHGDVYKMAYAIHDFHPMLSYLTIVEGGNPQTLVWLEPRLGFTPRFNSLEAVSRLSWFDLQNNHDLMYLASESDGLRRVIDALRARNR
jgi:Methyltransferase domain